MVVEATTGLYWNIGRGRCIDISAMLELIPTSKKQVVMMQKKKKGDGKDEESEGETREKKATLGRGGTGSGRREETVEKKRSYATGYSTKSIS